MRCPLHVVNTFTTQPFGGNPAAVVPLPHWLPDAVLQAAAAQHNLAETAFLVPAGEAWHLRWFTPAVEVDLCGHATLASAWVLQHRLGRPSARHRFLTRSGELTVRPLDDGRMELDLPAWPSRPVAALPAGLLAALGLSRAPQAALQHRDLLLVLEHEEEVRALQPDFAALARVAVHAVIATAPGREVDFVSRFFAPALGVAEDPVTGSAHSALVPYWVERLGRRPLRARQVSARGGELETDWAADRVLLTGAVRPYLEGTIELPETAEALASDFSARS